MSFHRGLSALATMLLVMSTSDGATVPGSMRNIPFGDAAGEPLYLDAAIPEGAGPFPAAIIVHGGAWVRGDRRLDVSPLFAPLTQAGIAWFSIDYRLAGDMSQIGSAIPDVEAAVHYVKSHASEYRIDPNRIALIGESAGGQLAAMAALDPQPGNEVQAVVALYAPTDLVELAENSSFVPKQVRDSIAGTPFAQMIRARLKQISPIDNVKRGAPPFLLIHGTADTLVPFSQSQAMCERLAAAGTTCKLYPVQGGGHGIRWWESAHPREAEAYKREMVAWLKQQFARADRRAA